MIDAVYHLEGSTQKEGKWQNVFDLRKARRDRSHKNKAYVICFVFVWTVLGALRNTSTCIKVSAIASLMCKSYKLCHLPAFCVKPYHWLIEENSFSFSSFYFCTPVWNGHYTPKSEVT